MRGIGSAIDVELGRGQGLEQMRLGASGIL